MWCPTNILVHVDGGLKTATIGNRKATDSTAGIGIMILPI